jgi:ribonuclease BN (tRNA processing enzyme)
VHHPVESCGFVITRGRTSMAMSGDTGPTDKLWKVLNQTPTLKALLVETSFPNALHQLADVSGHLTPKMLESELAKFQRNGCNVLVYHLKPAFLPQLKRELGEMPVEILELGDTFEF